MVQNPIQPDSPRFQARAIAVRYEIRSNFEVELHPQVLYHRAFIRANTIRNNPMKIRDRIHAETHASLRAKLSTTQKGTRHYRVQRNFPPTHPWAYKVAWSNSAETKTRTCWVGPVCRSIICVWQIKSQPHGGERALRYNISLAPPQFWHQYDF